jgi:hypothetical protein
MTSDKFRVRADESIKAAHAVADPVRKLALMDVAQRWLRLAVQIDGINSRPNKLRPVRRSDYCPRLDP